MSDEVATFVCCVMREPLESFGSKMNSNSSFLAREFDEGELIVNAKEQQELAERPV